MPSILDATSPEEFDNALQGLSGLEDEKESQGQRFQSGRESANDGIEELQNVVEAVTPAVQTVGKTVARTAQQAALPVYNSLYDVVAGAFGGDGLDIEVPTTELNEQGEFEYGTQLVRGTKPFLFGENNPRPQSAPFGRPDETFQGLIPTRNYNKLQPGGSYKLIEQNAPIPFIGRPELVDTGNPLVNFGADLVGMMGQLVAISRGKVDGKRLTGELSATTQRLLKANPKSIRGISRKGYEEFLPASVVQSVVRTAGMPGEGSTTGSVIKAFADLPIVKENVDPKLIERIVDVTNIDPDDPLLERVSPDPQGKWS